MGMLFDAVQRPHRLMRESFILSTVLLLLDTSDPRLQSAADRSRLAQ